MGEREDTSELIDLWLLLGPSPGTSETPLAALEPFEERFLLGPPTGGGENDGKDVSIFGDSAASCEALFCRLLFKAADDPDCLVLILPSMFRTD